VIGITFRSIDFFPARRCSPRSAANERPRPEVHSTGASGVTGPQSQLKPGRQIVQSKLRTDEYLKESKSKNYQDGCCKE
jgi:hypothetical protein